MNKVLAIVQPKDVWDSMGTQEKVDFFLSCWDSLSPSMKAHVASKFPKEDEMLLENELLMRKHEKRIY